MKCTRCGQPVDAGATFCGNCGQPVVPAAIAPPPPPPPASPTPGAAPSAPATVMAANNIPTPGMPAAVAPAARVPAYAGAGMAAPAYALPNQVVPAGGGKAIAGLVCGIVGLVGWLIPVVGLVLGIAALVLGTLSIKSPHRRLAIAGIVLAVPVLALSIFAWVYNIQHHASLGNANAASPVALRSVDTPCYRTQLDKSLAVTNTSGSCTIAAANNQTNEHYDIKALSVPGITNAELAVAAQKDIQNVINLNAGSKVASQTSGQFAGAPAYIYTLTNSTGGKATVDYVAYTAVKGLNVFVIDRFVDSGDASLTSLESNWAWK